ncbi:HMA2 domain-containing protein [Hyphomicrobium sp. 2TAF46]|uniref:HMA2 domain-containing protein n=1 Tax=Hyphomicrobium sp. 2TAF46 TaxID=3233019 RepID=UPI003F9226BF
MSLPDSSRPTATSFLPPPRPKKHKLKIDIAHQVPGRIRMKVGGGKGNPDLLKEVGDVFNVLPGIQRITLNPLTGSVVMHYDSKQNSKATAQNGAERGTAGMATPPSTDIDVLANKIVSQAHYLAEHSHAAKAVVDFFANMDRQIKKTSHNTVDLKIVFALGVIAVTVFEIGATTATPIWLTLAVFSINHFIEMHQPPSALMPVRAPIAFKGV